MDVSIGTIFIFILVQPPPLARPQEVVPQTLVFTCLPPLNVLVRTLSFPIL